VKLSKTFIQATKICNAEVLMETKFADVKVILRFAKSGISLSKIISLAT